MINVKEPPYNAVGDGVADDTQAVTAALAAVPLIGGEVYFPAGTYRLATWIVQDLGDTAAPPVPNDELGGVRLRGEAPGAVLLRGPGIASANHKFGRIRNSVTVSGLDFENWNAVLDGTGAGEVDVVSFTDCAVRDSGYFLQWTGGADFVHQLVVDRCDFHSLRLGVVMADVQADAVYFTRCRAIDCERYVLRVLSAAEQRTVRLVEFSDNYVSNLNANSHLPEYSVARVVQVNCERLVVTDNLVKKVVGQVGGGNVNFTYTSSLVSYVAGNYLEDIGIPGDIGSGSIIHEKSTDAISGRYLNNQFVQNPVPEDQPAFRAVAIQVQHRGHTVVQGNEARGLHNSFLVATHDPDNIVVSNNLVVDNNCFYGSIVIYGGRNVLIESNLIDGVRDTYPVPQPPAHVPWAQYPRGIRIERYVESGTPDVYHGSENVRIANNVINNVYGIRPQEGSGIFVYASGVQMTNISIVDNTITNCDKGVDLRVAGGSTFGDVEVSHNTFSGNRFPVYAPTLPAAFTTRANRGWATEASGVATVATGTTSVQVAHGLARTPTLAGITVTPASPPDGSGASRFWAAAPTATTFTINVDSAPGAGVDFAWTAQIL